MNEIGFPRAKPEGTLILYGHIHSYDTYRGVGLIAPDDGTLLGFRVEDVNAPKAIAPGRRVSFRMDDHVDYVYRVAVEGAPRLERSRITATLLAMLGGVFGLQKFYLGYSSLGVAILLISVGFAWTAVAPLATIGVGLIEGLIYLTMSDEKFERRYLVGRRYWL